VWGYNGDATRPYILYDFLIHGKRAGPEAFLKDYHGYLQCDAHSVYNQIFAPVNHEKALRRYCEDDRLEIDNNAAERMLRLIAIGRKNGLFYGSERQG
jgi:hypothetical protein